MLTLKHPLKGADLQESERKCREEIGVGEERFNDSRADFMDLRGQLSSLISTLELRQKVLVNCRHEILKCEKAHEEATKEAAELSRDIEIAQQRAHTMSLSYQRYQDELRQQAMDLDEARNNLWEDEEKLCI